MTALEKHRKEQDELKNSRINRILEVSYNLFSQHGIDTIAMADIAKASEIGVASLYRYFETKEEIAIQTAIWAWNKEKIIILPELQNKDYENLTGIEQIKKIIALFIVSYHSQRDFFRFIYFFDSYAVRQRLGRNRLKNYEKVINEVQIYVKNAIFKALSDNTINERYKNQEDCLSLTLMHTFFNAAQKLSLTIGLLESDTELSGEIQLELLSEIFIKALL